MRTPSSPVRSTHAHGIAVAIVTALVVLGVASTPRPAAAEPRFGDSTWVAPGPEEAEAGAPGQKGPRVAPPDHERGWETALRFPSRAVFFPVRLVARGMEAVVGHSGKFFPQLLGPRPGEGDHRPKSLGTVGIEGSYTGAGGLALGPSFTLNGVPVSGGRLKLSGTWSTHDNRRARLRETIGTDSSAVGVFVFGEYRYRPNRRFYGLGNETVAADRSIYLQEEGLGQGTVWFGAHPLARARVTGGYSEMSARRGYGGTRADLLFPQEVTFGRSRVAFYGAGFDLGTLDDLTRPSTGIHARADIRRVVDVDASENLDYLDWQAEARAYAPVFARRRVIALRAVYRAAQPGADSDPIPFFRLPTSEADLRFPGYASARFRDSHLFLGQAEYRWQIWQRLSAVLLAAAGQVAPTARALRVSDLHPAYGGGLRMPIGARSVARLEIVHGDDGTHFYVGTKGDF